MYYQSKNVFVTIIIALISIPFVIAEVVVKKVKYLIKHRIRRF